MELLIVWNIIIAEFIADSLPEYELNCIINIRRLT